MPRKLCSNARFLRLPNRLALPINNQTARASLLVGNTRSLIGCIVKNALSVGTFPALPKRSESFDVFLVIEPYRMDPPIFFLATSMSISIGYSRAIFATSFLIGDIHVEGMKHRSRNSSGPNYSACTIRSTRINYTYF